MFLENVKILDCSDLSLSEVSEHPSKKPTKKYYDHGKRKEKESIDQKSMFKRSFIQSKKMEKSYNTIDEKSVGFNI